jgi:hypothetical protein
MAGTHNGDMMRRFNEWLATKISAGVGTMWCAYLFTALALVSLPASIASGSPVVVVAWIAQTFLQLVLLSVILVAQNLQATKQSVHTEMLTDLHLKADLTHAKLDALSDIPPLD